MAPRLFLLMAALMVLSAQLLADELAAPAGAAPGSALVDDPCSPALPMPEAMPGGMRQMLQPGKTGEDAPPQSARADVQASGMTAQERARADWPNLCKYRAANAALPKPVRVVFMGDSITEIWAQSEPQLFSGGVVGRGISGQTSPQMLLRFFQDVLSLHPKQVHIMAGTNDLAGNTGPSAAQDFKNNIMAMVELAQVHHIKVLLASIPPARSFPWKKSLSPAADIVTLNHWLKDYAAATGSQYLDYYSLLVDDQGGFQAPLSNDGVHPNRDGYLRMRSLVLKALVP